MCSSILELPVKVLDVCSLLYIKEKKPHLITTKMFRYILRSIFTILRASISQECGKKAVEKACAQFVVGPCACALRNLIINFRTRNDITFSILPHFTETLC